MASEGWAYDWPRLNALGEVGAEWTWDTPLRTEYARRAALVEIDALVAVWLGFEIDEFLAAYESRFGVLAGHEEEMYFDANGRKLAAIRHVRSRADQGALEAVREVPGGSGGEPGAGRVRGAVLQGGSGRRVPAGARCVRRAAEASTRGRPATRSGLAVWRTLMPFVRRPVRLTGGDIPERPSAPQKPQKKRRRGLGLIEARVPVSSEQQARLEQERAARKQAKEISKARKNVDPDSAGVTTRRHSSRNRKSALQIRVRQRKRGARSQAPLEVFGTEHLPFPAPVYSQGPV